MIAERDAALKAEYALQAAIEEFLRELSAKAVIRKDYGRFGRFAARFKWGPMERPTITVE
jgi:hypothetical protein